MSEQRLHDLLAERVDGLESDDLAGTAWRRAAEVRRRRRTLVGVVVAVAAVIGGVGGLVATGADGPSPSPATSSTAPTGSASTVTPLPSGPAPTAPTATPAGRQHGAAVWWAPAKGDEADLPLLDGTGIPEEIDLSPGAPAHRPGVPARAVFTIDDGETATPDRVVVLGEDGATYSLATRLQPVADQGGNAYSPLGQESLAPDGRRVFFRQASELVVYDLMSGAWTSIDVPAWRVEGTRWFSADELWVPEVLGDEDGPGTVYDLTGRVTRTDWRAHYALWTAGGGQPFGPQALDPVGVHLSGFGPATAQAQFSGVELVDPDGVRTSGMDVVVTRDQSFSKLAVLVLPYGAGDGTGRWKGCCPVVGWLGGPEILLFESRGADTRVLAWRVGTRQAWRVTRLLGWVPGEEVVVGSWATFEPA